MSEASVFKLVPEHKYVLAVPESFLSHNTSWVKVMEEATNTRGPRERIFGIKSGEAADSRTIKFCGFTFEGQDRQALSTAHSEFYIVTRQVDTLPVHSTKFDSIHAQPAIEGKRKLLPVWAMDKDVTVQNSKHTVTRKLFGRSTTSISSPIIDLIGDDAWKEAQAVTRLGAPMTFAEFRAKVIAGEFIPRCPELNARSLKLLYGDELDMPEELVLANRPYRQ